MKKTFIFIILLLAIGFIFYFWQQNNQPPVVSTTQNWKVSFQFSESESIDINFSNEEALSLAKITELISQQEAWDYKFDDYGEMGILLSQIKDKKNGQDQKYWQYFVAGEQPQISIDKYFPADNTHVEWKFAKSEF